MGDRAGPEAGGDVVVVGGGVIGLTVAVAAAEAGRGVTVVTDRPPLDTTSRVAGAVWQPYLSGGAAVLRWAATTYRALARLAGTGGVALGELRMAGPVSDPPPWAASVDGLRALRPDELLAGWAEGYVCVVPLVDMGAYLPYLEDRLVAAGGRVRRARVASLGELAPAAAVVNCTGLGARALVPDPSLRAVRGQLVVVRSPGLVGAWIDESGPGVAGAPATYAIAHAGEVVVGGTADDGDESLEVDPRTAVAILRRAGSVDPRLTGAEVVGHRVGLRPWRPEVRLEAGDTVDGVGRVVHCYGHGGSGVTLSWGCAADVVELLAARRPGTPSGSPAADRGPCPTRRPSSRRRT